MTKPGAWAELRSGWFLLVACAIGVGCSPIAIPFYSIGPLTKPIAADMGWLRSDIQLAILFSSGIGALTAPVTGWMIDRFGVRLVAIPSLIGVSAGLFLASMATTLTGFWAGYAMAAILGAGANPVLWSRVIAGSFDKARGAALGLALLGTAIMALILPVMISAIEPDQGWRTALRSVAALPVLLALPIVYLLLRPRQIIASDGLPLNQTGVSLAVALRDYRFWVLTASILCAYLGISGAVPNLVPAFTDRGLTASVAAGLAGAFAISIIPGRILAGVLMDRFWAPAIACSALLLPAIGCIMLMNATNPTVLLAACFMLGIAAGAELDVLAFMTARYFGLAHYPKIYAFSYVALATGSATAPTLFSRVHETTGNYEMSFAIASGLFVVAALLLLLMGRYPDVRLQGKSNS